MHTLHSNLGEVDFVYYYKTNLKIVDFVYAKSYGILIKILFLFFLIA